MNFFLQIRHFYYLFQVWFHLKVVYDWIKLVSVLFFKSELTNINFFRIRLTVEHLLSLKNISFWDSLFRSWEDKITRWFDLIFLLYKSLDLIFVWILSFDSVDIIIADMIDIIVKIYCRHTIAHVVFTDSQLINCSFLIIFAINENSKFHCICVLLKCFLILHLITIKLTQIKECA